jgi:hypothetical protein
LWPGGSRGWDWNETGTSHVPGVQVADVEELLAPGARAVVSGRGMHGRLERPAGTRAELERAESRSADLTPAAVETTTDGGIRAPESARCSTPPADDGGDGEGYVRGRLLLGRRGDVPAGSGVVDTAVGFMGG